MEPDCMGCLLLFQWPNSVRVMVGLQIGIPVAYESLLVPYIIKQFCWKEGVWLVHSPNLTGVMDACNEGADSPSVDCSNQLLSIKDSWRTADLDIPIVSEQPRSLMSTVNPHECGIEGITLAPAGSMLP
jgi:hypothetical protein